MKRFAPLMIVLAVVLFMAQVAPAQTMEDVVARAVNAMGGTAKLEAIKTMSMTMSGKMQGSMEIEMTMYTMQPKHFRMEMKMMGQNMIVASDGTDTWMQMMGRVMDVPGAQSESNKLMGEGFGGQMVLAMQKLGATYAGAEDFRGQACDVLTWTDPDSKMVTKSYFSKASGLMAGTRSKTDKGEVTMAMGDYKDVAGCKMPHLMETFMNDSPLMTLTVTDVKINPTIDATLFARPK